MAPCCKWKAPRAPWASRSRAKKCVGGRAPARPHTPQERAMQKHGKKYRAAAAQVNRNQAYAPKEALALAKATSISKFDGSVEVHMRMGLDPKQADQQVRSAVVMPAGLGKHVRVMVFVEGGAAPGA